jgi:hypothetical protein
MRPVPALLLFALLASLPQAAPATTEPPQCLLSGTWQVDGPPIFPTALAVQDAIVIDHRSVAIASGCAPTPAVFRPLRGGGWMVHARWKECRSARGVYLRAKVSSDCSKMSGAVVARHPQNFERRFTAARCDNIQGCDRRCTDNGQCRSEDYCAKQLGQCAAQGRCAPRPQACPDIYLPVCGCDGRTYSNACDAAAAGANVARLGACDSRCDVTHPCGPGQFCELPVGVCASALDAGQCVDAPEICPNDFCGTCGPDEICPLAACPLIYQPVCGCDGRTYSSECERRKAKVSKSHDGPCLCPAILCAPGTKPVDRDGDGCAESCLAPCNDACDCKNNPDLQLRNDCPMLCPTCGNHWRCEAGYCVDTCGPKPPEECRQCGGLPGFPCRAGEVCDLPPGTCGWADLFGQCKPVGDACIALWDPVCGCDGRTYGNDCERLRAGAQLDHRGECTSRPVSSQ